MVVELVVVEGVVVGVGARVVIGAGQYFLKLRRSLCHKKRNDNHNQQIHTFC